MNKYNYLLTKIADEYGIKQGKNEHLDQYKSRIIYSVMGRMSLASLFDNDEEEAISITHMKTRIGSLLESYREMYPEVSHEITVAPDQLADEIYDIFLNTGNIYHEPNRVVMASPSIAVARNGLTLTRGIQLDTAQHICGIGTYMDSSPTACMSNISDMFLLEHEDLCRKWERYAKSANWKKYDGDIGIEYLRITPPFKRGYWVDKPDLSGNVSMMRTGFKGSQLYFLYRYENNNCMVSQIPQWETENYKYRSLANTCLAYKAVLPKTTYKTDGNIVHVLFGYLPPPSELYLWKLYSWPSSMQNFPCDFHRICDYKIFECIREQMEHIGYLFTEE